MLNEFRHAFRALRRSAGFTIVAVATLALGIGANTALFSVADGVLLRPLPYRQPDRVVWLDEVPFQITRAGMKVHRNIRTSAAFDGVGLYAPGALNVGGDPVPERVPAAAVSAEFFAALGLEPSTGRTFSEAEEAAGARVALISHSLWTRRGRTIEPGHSLLVNGRAFTVLGVMPPRAAFPGRTEVWIPVGSDNQITGRAFAPEVIARLASGVTPEQGRREIERINEALGSGVQESPVRVVRLHEQLTGTIRPLLLALAAAVLLVLLVACINTASLLLARLSVRERDLAIRRALGASRLRLVRHLFAESLILSASAGLLAIPVAMWTLDGVRALLPPALHGVTEIAVDGRAILMTATLSVLSTFLFGVAPAWSMQHARDGGLLHAGMSSTSTPFWRRFRSALVIAEIAVALVLIAGAATIVRTVGTLMAVDIGVSGERAITMETTLPLAQYGSTERVSAFHERLETALAGIPGVEAVGATNLLPGSQEFGVGLQYQIEGDPAPEGVRRMAGYLSASPDYFRAIGIELLAGRAFTAADRLGAPPVTIISASVAASAGLTPWEAIGRRTRIGFDKQWATIVGVVRDVRMKGPEAPQSTQVYVPVAQAPPDGTTFVVVNSGRDAAELAPALRAAIAGVDPGLPLYNVQTFDDVRAALVANRRFAMAIMSAFAALVAILAGIGLYGVLTHLVQLRRREIGIRVALGASPGTVRRQVIGSGLLHAAAGAGIGALLAAAALRLMTSRVPGLEPAEPVLLAWLAAAMLIATVIVTWFPARRATRIDPLIALRED